MEPLEGGVRAGSGTFADYRLEGRFFDELFGADGSPRPACRRLGEALGRVPPDELARIQESVHRRFLHEGITFTVLGKDEVSERIIPIDCVPRIVASAEWQEVEEGIKQRMRAINLFLRDIYHEGRSLRDGVVPAELVLGCPQYRVEMRGVRVPHDVYVAVGAPTWCGPTGNLRCWRTTCGSRRESRTCSRAERRRSARCRSCTGSIGCGRSRSTPSGCTRLWRRWDRETRVRAWRS